MKNTAENRLKVRWVPPGSMVIKHKAGASVGVVYVRPANRPEMARRVGLDGQVQVVGYRGTAMHREFNYVMKPDKVAQYVKEFFAGIDARNAAMSKRRKASFEPHNFKVNDIVTNSWGYDQTNVDFYRVTKATGHFVWLKAINASVKEDGFMSGPTEPVINTNDPDPSKWSFSDKKDPEEKHKATGDRVSMKYGGASKWNGQPMHCSWYA